MPLRDPVEEIQRPRGVAVGSDDPRDVVREEGRGESGEVGAIAPPGKGEDLQGFGGEGGVLSVVRVGGERAEGMGEEEEEEGRWVRRFAEEGERRGFHHWRRWSRVSPSHGVWPWEEEEERERGQV